MRGAYTPDYRCLLARAVVDTMTEYRLPERIMRSKLSPTAKLVYAVLLRHTGNGETEAKLGIAQLAAETGLSYRTITRALAALSKPGVLGRRLSLTGNSAPDRWTRYRLRCVRRFPRAIG